MHRLIFGTAQIETINYFSWQLYYAAQKRGIESLIINMDTLEDFTVRKRLLEFIAEGDCQMIAFNLRSDVPIWEGFNIPVYDILVDHPRRYIQFYGKAIPRLSLIVLDRKQVQYCEEHFPEVQHTFFMPLGGTREGKLTPFEERYIGVMYAGSNCYSPYYPILPFLKDRGKKFYEDAYSLIIEQPDLTGEEILNSIGEAKQIDFRNSEWRPYIWKIADTLEQNARALYKQKMMKLLSESGIEVEVYGNNWEIPGYSYKDNIHFPKTVRSREINRITGKAQISLNSMPWFKDGAHDRIFTAMLNGAISMTDPSKYLMERFENGKNIVYYNLADMEPMIDNIRFLQSHPKTAAEIARQGRLIAEREDTWDNRLSTLLKYMDDNDGN